MIMKIKTILAAALLAVTAFQANAGDIPRKEYPRPQFERATWINLNGTWDYTFDFSNSGLERGLMKATSFDGEIVVPFCPESSLSGVGYKDFINHIWYHREITVPQDWSGKNILLNFGAVYFNSEVYIDGVLANRHFGGSSSFSVDITQLVKPGQTHHLVVRASSDLRSTMQSAGKQNLQFASYGCNYTRTTGIWQTVWMEAVDTHGLKSVRILPELDRKSFVIQPEFYALKEGMQLEVVVKDGENTVCRQVQRAATPLTMTLPLKKVKTWEPGSPFLYDIVLNVLDKDGKPIDQVKSYAGMRKVHIEGNKLYLNNKPCYLRLVLDQGFYPTGVWTAPTDADLKRDIELGLAAGFNGARLHQKVFEERFHYWADKLGYLTWGESASWGASTSSTEAARNFLTEWEEIVVRDRNHPSIIAWTPFNETWDRPGNDEQARQHDRFISDVYKLSHHLDYRPVNDASGNYHVMTDLWSVHHYAQSAQEMVKRLEPVNGVLPQKDLKKEVPYAGQPYFVDEYGGIKWVSGNQFSERSWGYGNGPKTPEEFYTRLKELTDVILSYDHISGYCYTQLTDVEQEQNGIYNYDRTPKFDMERIRAVFLQEK